MNRKLLFPILIVALFFIGLLLKGLIYEYYNINSYFRFAEYVYRYHTISTFISFLSMSVFYIIMIVYYKDFKLVAIFSAINLLIAFSFAGYIALNQYYPFQTAIVRIYAGTTYFLGFFNILLASAILYKEDYHKILSITLLYTSIVTFMVGTLITDYIKGYITQIFGLGTSSLVSVVTFYDIITVILQLSIIVLQAISIIKVVEYKEYGKVLYKRKAL